MAPSLHLQAQKRTVYLLLRTTTVSITGASKELLIVFLLMALVNHLMISMDAMRTMLMTLKHLFKTHLLTWLPFVQTMCFA